MASDLRQQANPGAPDSTGVWLATVLTLLLTLVSSGAAAWQTWLFYKKYASTTVEFLEPVTVEYGKEVVLIRFDVLATNTGNLDDRINNYTAWIVNDEVDPGQRIPFDMGSIRFTEGDPKTDAHSVVIVPKETTKYLTCTISYRVGPENRVVFETPGTLRLCMNLRHLTPEKQEVWRYTGEFCLLVDGKPVTENAGRTLRFDSSLCQRPECGENR